jgi:hypothetical protein
MRQIIILIALCVLSGCATTANYEKVLNTWVGSNINSLTNSWGYPASSFVAPDGNTVYVYTSSGSYTTPVQTTFNDYNNTAYSTGGDTLTFSCKTYFEVDCNKKIISWRYEGNNCVSYAPATK